MPCAFRGLGALDLGPGQCLLGHRDTRWGKMSWVSFANPVSFLFRSFSSMSDITGNSQGPGGGSLWGVPCHWPRSCVCLLFWPVFPLPWPVCAPDQLWKLCERLLRNRVLQRLHLLLGVPCVALHFLPTSSSSRKLEAHPAARSQPCAPGAISPPTLLSLPSAVSVVQTSDLPLPPQGV